MVLELSIHQETENPMILWYDVHCDTKAGSISLSEKASLNSSQEQQENFPKFVDLYIILSSVLIIIVVSLEKHPFIICRLFLTVPMT